MYEIAAVRNNDLDSGHDCGISGIDQVCCVGSLDKFISVNAAHKQFNALHLLFRSLRHSINYLRVPFV